MQRSSTGTAMDALAAALSSAQSVAVLCGAGLSVASGIPDFRSPGGLYDTLRPDLITASPAERDLMRQSPTAVVDWGLFQHNQLPYLEVRRPFILGINAEPTADPNAADASAMPAGHVGKVAGQRQGQGQGQGQQWRPTLGHYFLRELEDRGKLHRVYSQNIDGLDHRVGVPAEKLLACHGSLGQASCEFCGAGVDMPWFLDALRRNVKDIYGVDADAPAESAPVACPRCGKAGVKPSTVLYGRPLPAAFREAMHEDFPEQVDLLVVMGTSLTVGPANSIPGMVTPATTRLVINREPVGQRPSEGGIRYAEADVKPEGDAKGDAKGDATGLKAVASQCGRDFFMQGECDEMVLALLDRLGWTASVAKYRPFMCESAQALLPLPAPLPPALASTGAPTSPTSSATCK